MLGRSLISLSSIHFLVLARFGGFLLQLVFILAAIHDFANRRVGAGRNLDQVEALFLGEGNAFAAGS